MTKLSTIIGKICVANDRSTNTVVHISIQLILTVCIPLWSIYSHWNKYKTPHKFCYNAPIRLSHKEKFSPITGNDIKILYSVFITTINNFSIIPHYIFFGAEINIRRIAKSSFSTTISKFLEIAIELYRWQFLVTVSIIRPSTSALSRCLKDILLRKKKKN